MMMLRSLDELRSLTEAHIKVEREIDTELRPRPIKDVSLLGPTPVAKVGCSHEDTEEDVSALAGDSSPRRVLEIDVGHAADQRYEAMGS